jgi:hypothetical protein
MRAFPPFRFWLPPLLGAFAGIVLLFLTRLVHHEGPMLDFVRALHYTSNQFMLGWDAIFPLYEQRAVLLVEGVAFVAQWMLLGLCIGWMVRKFSHDKSTA